MSTQEVDAEKDLIKLCNLGSKCEYDGDVIGAIRHFKAAAEGGCTVAMSALGRIYFHGQGVPENPILGVEWHNRCVDRGATSTRSWDPAVASSQGSLGQAYRHGIAVEKNIAQALKLLCAAANADDVTSMNNYGSLLADIGREDEAATWYLRAAVDYDYCLSKMNLAIFLRDGRGGLERDLLTAKELLESAVNEDPRAIGLLASISEQLQTPLKVRLKEHRKIIENQKKHGKVEATALVILADLHLQLQWEEDQNLRLSDR